MIEDGPETFVQRWRTYAAEAILFARPEGSPLLEAELGGAVIQLLERTNPYLAVPGAARLLVNATVATVEPCEGDAPELTVPARGALAGRGVVLERDGRLLAVDAGAPLVLACERSPGVEVGEGTMVRFEADAPVHGFVLPPERRADPQDGRAVDEAH